MHSNWAPGTITNQLILAANSGQGQPLIPATQFLPRRIVVDVATICMYWVYLNDLYSGRLTTSGSATYTRESVY